jgi:hypothetical protein
MYISLHLGAEHRHRTITITSHIPTHDLRVNTFKADRPNRLIAPLNISRLATVGALVFLTVAELGASLRQF